MDFLALPDRFWTEAAVCLERLVEPGDLLLAPPEFLQLFTGTIALHVPKRMLPVVVITHYVLHKRMLDRIDPDYLLEASAAIPVFANEVFVIFSRRGEKLPDEQALHLISFFEYLENIPPKPCVSYETAIVVTTYNRPWALQRTLNSLVRQGLPIIVVDDGSSCVQQNRNSEIVHACGATYVFHPVNLGVSHALNIGIGHWLAHPQIEWISTFNDDVEVAGDMFAVLEDILRQAPYHPSHTLYTGYWDSRHAARENIAIAGRQANLARSCSGVHLHAHRDYWQSVLPIPTTYPGAPKKLGGKFPGQGFDADWWVGSWSPYAAPKRGGHIVAIPDLVSTFATNADSSTWGNQV